MAATSQNVFPKNLKLKSVLYISCPIPLVYSYNHSDSMSPSYSPADVMRFPSSVIIPGQKHDFANKFILNSSTTII